MIHIVTILFICVDMKFQFCCFWNNNNSLHKYLDLGGKVEKIKFVEDKLTHQFNGKAVVYLSNDINFVKNTLVNTLNGSGVKPARNKVANQI